MRAIMVAALALALAGCGTRFTGVYDLPLPGGADLGSHPYQVTAQFTNVRDLVPQAAVKVNDIAVGRVTKITLPNNGWTANVIMQVNGNVHLPANAYARLEQSSLLGEKYVQLSSPPVGQGALTNGATIPVSRTNRDVEVEEVFGALSLLLNGGGLSQLKNINHELNQALAGHEPQIRSVLERTNVLVSDLAGHRKDIIGALDGLDRLTATLAARKQQIGEVLDDFAPGLKVLEEQRGALVTMLRSLDDLSGVATRVMNKSKNDTIADFRDLAPILGNLANAGRDLPKSLQILLTYPFTDEALKAIKGDYLNVFLSITAAPGTQIIPPVLPPQEAGDSTFGTTSSAQRAVPAPVPLPPVGGATTTPTPGTARPGSAPPGSTLPGATPPPDPSESSTGGN